jgi:WD40 repeat protein
MRDAGPGRLNRENPWLGLEAFEEADAHYFHGRERETAESLRMVQREKLTVLLGRSGRGKTSLIKAGLFPVLRQQNFIPIYIRLDLTTDDPGPRQQVFDALFAQCAAGQVEASERVDDETLGEYFHRTKVEFWNDSNRLVKPVLAFDQFEEIFTRGSENDAARRRSRQFLVELGDLIEGRAPQHLTEALENEASDITKRFDFDKAAFKVLLSIREDYFLKLEEHKRTIPLLHNRYTLKAMDFGEATEVIVRNGAELVDEEVAARIVAVAAGRGNTVLPPEEYGDLEIDPAILSFICSELNRKRVEKSLSKITGDLLLGAEHEILSEFYERGMNGLDPNVRRFVEDELLTMQGYRDSYAFDRALALPGVTQKALERLVNDRLLRVDDRFGVRRLELTHDVLTSVVRESRDARKLQEAEQAARERELAQKNQAEERERTLRREAKERERALRRKLSLVATFAGLVVIASAAFVWQSKMNAARTLSLSLASAGRALLKTEGDLGLLLAIEAQNVHATDQATTLLRRWQSEIDPRVHKYLSLHPGRAGPVAIRSDGKLLATANGKTVLLWDANGQKVRDALDAHQAFVTSIVFSPDGTQMASASEEGRIVVQDVKTWKPVELQAKGENPALCLAFSPDSKFLVSGHENTSIKVWNVGDHQMLGSPLTGHQGAVTAVAFSPDQHAFASAGKDKRVLVWNLETREVTGGAMGESNDLTAVAFSPDGETIAAGDVDGKIALWDVKAQTTHLLYTGREVSGLTFLGIGRIASGSADGAIAVWDLSEGARVEITGSGETKAKFAFSHDGKLAARASGDLVTLFGFSDTGLNPDRLLGHNGDVTGIRFSADGNTLASVAEDGSARVWNVVNRRLLGTIPLDQEERPLALGRGPTDFLLAATNSAGQLQVRHFDAQKSERRVLENSTGPALVSFSADGRFLVSKVDDIVQLWDTTNGKAMGRQLQSDSAASRIPLSPDGKIVALGDDEGWVELVPTTGGDGLRCTVPQKSLPMAFSADGKRLAVLSAENIVQCNTETGKLVGTPWQAKQVNDLVYNPNNRLIATSAPREPFVLLWDADKGNKEQELFGDERHYSKQNTMSALAFSPDGKALAVANNNTILLADLDLNVEATKEKMCLIANRNLTCNEWREFLGNRTYHATCPRYPADPSC